MKGAADLLPDGKENAFLRRQYIDFLSARLYTKQQKNFENRDAEMKNSKIWTVLSIFVLILQVAAEALTAAIILRLNVLPDKYTVVLFVVLALLVLMTGLLLFARGKKPVSTARRIVASILALLIVCGCALLAKVAADAYQTIHAVTNTGEETSVRNMYVFVRNEDPAQSLADAAGYSFAIVEEYDVEHTQQAIIVIEEQTGQSLDITGYEKTSDLADALFDSQTDAVIMNGAAVTLLMEDEAYADFTQKARILYAIPLTQLEETEPSTEPSTEPPEIEENVTNSPFVVYISGSDTRSSKLNVSRSDVNILAVVNPVTKQVLLLNTPRDYYVPNPAGGGKLDKLTHCGLYGTDCSMEALEDLYDLEIDYYAQINFDGFETLIDAVGGVTIYSDQSFTARDTYIRKGENYLTGAKALDLVRERYHVSGGDNGRGKNQMKVVEALIGKLTNGTTIISNYSAILKSLEGMFKTSISTDEISMLVKMQLEDMASWNVQSFAVTGTGGSEKTYSAPGVYAYVMHPNETVVAYAGELADRVIAGEILTAEDMTVPE